MLSALPGNPSVEHERLRAALHAIGQLMGYRIPGTVPLPDGSVPDVLLVAPERGAVFIGDAKHTESPMSFETYRRLLRYRDWWTSADGLARAPSVLALAFSRGDQRASWRKLMEHLSTYAIGPAQEVLVASIDYRTHLCAVATPGKGMRKYVPWG